MDRHTGIRCLRQFHIQVHWTRLGLQDKWIVTHAQVGSTEFKM
jgi:hypothetical protein